ncbi:MAG: type II toxin-antitoxin system VapC family toxin [Thermodesulfobacteriota bacterium]|nr:type II toxin-antitoxin system VapC family toxin [Thermodesulfobacteriota bacterium]
MNSFLLDSDVIIWHLRGRKEVTEMLRDLQKFGLPACSALSVLEVQLGVKKGEEEKTDRFFKSLRILDVNMEIANHAARLIREYRAKGVTIDLPDAIIASTCIIHDLTLVTYNTKHYPIAELKFYPVPQNNP